MPHIVQNPTSSQNGLRDMTNHVQTVAHAHITAPKMARAISF